MSSVSAATFRPIACARASTAAAPDLAALGAKLHSELPKKISLKLDFAYPGRVKEAMQAEVLAAIRRESATRMSAREP